MLSDTAHEDMLSQIMQVDNQVYFEITKNSSVSQLSILLIIVGLFIMIVGGIGSVGAIFASTIFGRITLGLVSQCMCMETAIASSN